MVNHTVYARTNVRASLETASPRTHAERQSVCGKGVKNTARQLIAPSSAAISMDSPVTQQMTRASLNVAFESTSLRQSLVASVGKEMAPQELPLPGTRPTATEEVTVDTNILRNTPEKVAGLRPAARARGAPPPRASGRRRAPGTPRPRYPPPSAPLPLVGGRGDSGPGESLFLRRPQLPRGTRRRVVQAEDPLLRRGALSDYGAIHVKGWFRACTG